jgi:ubiquinone/menaquinone biosynthesis C-methylase UbiE
MERILEPELMDSEAQTGAYARADFDEPNRLFVQAFFQRFGPGGAGGEALDLGCGPADIVIRFAHRYPACQVTGADAGQNMLRQAARAVTSASMKQRIKLALCRLPDLSRLSPPYDAIISNSLLHHLPLAETLWQAVRALGAPGTRVMVMDLRRPRSRPAARAIVETYAGGEPDVLKEDFENSLCAAFTPEEITDQLREHDLGQLEVSRPSDRHVMVAGVL